MAKNNFEVAPMGPSDELCLSYFRKHKLIQLIQRDMNKFCCPRSLLRVPGCPHAANDSDCYCEFQQAHIYEAWKAAKEYGYDDDAAKEGRAAVDGCPECSQFQKDVDERKAVKRSLGAIKGAICRRGEKLAVLNGSADEQ
jgi:hypothetical protein